MAFVLRGLGRSVSSMRPTSSCLGINWWQAVDGRYYSSSEGSNVSDEEEQKAAQRDKAKVKREEAKLKLNSLLESIEKTSSLSGDDNIVSGVSSRLAQPGARPRPREVVPNKRHAPAATSTTTSAQPDRQPTLDEQVAAAAREVATSLGGDTARTERDLLSKLSEDQDQSSAGQTQLGELMSSMKVDQQSAAPPGRAQHVRHQMGGQRAETLRQARRERQPNAVRAPRSAGAAFDQVDLNAGDVLGIFSAMQPADAAAEVTPCPPAGQWERIHARELRLSVAHPPANAWEEMAAWTEQGKLWHLPIDNEQGLEREADVAFHEHVFLDHRLEPWCPPRGPIRQFMELVCIALGKNPWLSVEEKHEHIEWFREYFAGKQRLLQELKAV